MSARFLRPLRPTASSFSLWLVLCSSLVFAADRFPAMHCARHNARHFRCTIENALAKYPPSWTLYAEPYRFFTRGTTAIFPIPEKWSLIECRVEDDENVQMLHALVRQHKGKLEFRQFAEGGDQ